MLLESLTSRIQSSTDGERDFEDAIETEEYVVPVTIHPDGTFTDDCGRMFNLAVD